MDMEGMFSPNISSTYGGETMKKALILATLVVMLIPCKFAGADEASPYLMGEWFLGDSIPNQNIASNTTVAISDTQFTFLNPTNQTLNLEYAFFDVQGGFCGCDRDILSPNGRTRYTMSGEVIGGQFICTKANNNQQTEGTMKTIVFQLRGHDSIDIEDALQIGYQIHIFKSGEKTEAGLKAIPVNHNTFREIKTIHKKCVDFCNQSGLCPPLQ
jgi:hypothetical protein